MYCHVWDKKKQLRLMESAVEFVWWWGWGLHSHFHVQANYSVEVVLYCVVIGVVTISGGSVAVVIQEK